MADLNSIEFAWHNMEVVVLGRTLVRILELKVKPSRQKKPIKGRGSKTLGFGRGNYEYSGTLKVGQSEHIALEKALGDILDTSFDINVAYTMANSAIPATHRKRILGVDVEGFEEGMSQGDSDMEVTYTFQCRDMITV